MATIDGLVVRVGTQRFVLPSPSVLRAVWLSPHSMIPIQA
jgi:hypothetical protein